MSEEKKVSTETKAPAALPLPASIPTFSASIALVGIANREFNIVLARARPKLNAQGIGLSTNGEMQPVSLLYLTPHCAKDLCEALTKAVQGYEDNFGEISKKSST